ncbi:hypothetical protein [Biformimicrobium ophioploci]|uniref:DUF4136 domain-containing protein n=1 Tax=Biformimicrobium ophioploci TaxID=3036711 RepID=A0ABQ6M0L9_9GAMM|nr:hypothetical protein [Microbulbifer sp. NKW57]GMG87895.1 hypothetical protein MNKW57_22160 [Microbulbifer sp. NKW57]
MKTFGIRTRSIKTALVACLAGLLASCAQAPQAPSEAHLNSVRASGLDHVATVFAFDLAGASVFVAEPELEYRRRSSSDFPRHSPEDFELDDRNRARLRDVMETAFAESFLAPRRSTVAASVDEADYRMQFGFEDFGIAAPLDLEPMTRYYAQYSASGKLYGRLYDREGNLVMEFNDRRDIGDNWGRGMNGGNLDRFTRITFWSDMRNDMRKAFKSLDRALQAGG